jgi:hypothetical protein
MLEADSGTIAPKTTQKAAERWKTSDTKLPRGLQRATLAEPHHHKQRMNKSRAQGLSKNGLSQNYHGLSGADFECALH